MAKAIKNKNKSVLVIAYSFPPVGRDRSTRTLKFVKFLARMGWEITVLTVKRPLVPHYDYSLANNIPAGIKVVRTSSAEGNCFRKITNPDTGLSEAKISVLHKIIKQLSNCLMIPDSRIGWIPFAVLSGIKIVKHDSVDIIYVSGEPFSSFISAAIIKMLTWRPLILDFRDDWTGFNGVFRKKNKLVQVYERFLEKTVVNCAEAVITVNTALSDDLRKRHLRNSEKTKFFNIYNGFDREDLMEISLGLDVKSSVLRLVYAGSLYPKRSAFAFLSALREIVLVKPELGCKIKVIFAGNDYIKKELSAYKDLNGIIEYVGFLPHAETLTLMKSAHALIFIEDQSELSNRVLSGKIFDYILCERPILAIANDGLVKDMVLRASIGRVAASNDTIGIKECLLELLDEFTRAGKLNYSPNEIFINGFQRQAQAQQLSGIMSDIIKNQKDKSKV